MAASDASLQWFLLKVIAPVLVLMMLLKVFRKQWTSIHRKLFADIEFYVGKQLTKTNFRQKQELLSALADRKKELQKNLTVVELGAGGGTNFQFYPEGTRVICVEPNEFFNRHILDQKASLSKLDIEIVTAFGEDMSEIESNSCDAVVCTFVFCTVLDQRVVIKEVKRILKPGGEFYFLEHVAAEKGTWLFLLQKIVNPLWNFFTLGCCLQRQTWVIIEQAGFSKVDYKKFSSRIRMPVVKPSIYGTATK